jgi:thiamine-phosphate pyrophosphorylase
MERPPLSAPFRTCLITASERFGVDRTVEIAATATAAGVGAIQIREKHLSARQLLSFTRRIMEATSGSGARILVNGRLDVALAAEADGVHLGGDALHPEAARELVSSQGREGFLIGASTHSMAEVARASAGGVDYVVFGPVFASPGKADERTALGLEVLQEVCARHWVPVLALGGITPQNALPVLEAGADGTAAIRAIFEAEDPETAARAWVNAHMSAVD